MHGLFGVAICGDGCADPLAGLAYKCRMKLLLYLSCFYYPIVEESDEESVIVSRAALTLNKLIKEGLIAYEGKYIRVLDKDNLENICNRST